MIGIDVTLNVENFSQRMGEAADRHCRPARSERRAGEAGHRNARDVRLHEQPPSRVALRASRNPLHRFEEALLVLEVDARR